MSGVGLRRRRPDDITPLAAILAETRRDDGYPPHWPAAGEFLIATADELDAYVCEADDGGGPPIGHVALHRRSARAVMEVAVAATGLGADGLTVVARLFVAASARRSGVGRALLDRATARAHELGRQPVLDVWDQLPDARALYESAGWTIAGRATLEFRSGCTDDCVHTGSSIESLVLIGPSPSPSPSPSPR
jgi:GNAT superfamily N-acetyltransferase